jgi:UrcA family protein
MNTAKLINSKSMNVHSLRRVTLAALVCVLGTAPTWAGPSGPSITVSFRDLDLSSIEGATALYHRIQAAAKQVCGRPGPDLLEQGLWRSCYRNATADAVGKVNSPLLTAVHKGRTPEMTAMLSK